MRAKRVGYVVTFLGERSKSVTPAAGENCLGLTTRIGIKTSRCNLAIEISFEPSSQSRNVWAMKIISLHNTLTNIIIFDGNTD